MKYLPLSPLCVIVLSLITTSAFAQTTLLSTNFSNGLGSFTSSGYVSTGSYGARLRAGSRGPGLITSAVINVSGHTNIALEFTRSASSLEAGESGNAEVSVDGGPFQLLESIRTGSGVIRFPIANAQSSVQIRFRLNANSAFDYYTIGNLSLAGAASGGGGGGGGGGGDPSDCGPIVDINAAVIVNGYGFNGFNTRNQASAINSGNVASLRLRYAFATSGTETKRGAPSVTEQAVFFYADDQLKAINRQSGCEFWTYNGDNKFKSSSVLFVKELGMIVVGDDAGYVHAVDAANGRLIWRKFAGTAPAHMITGGIQYHDGRLFVPVASREVLERQTTPCCETHGMLRAYNASNGAEIWTYHTTANARYTFGSRGPSGVSVWSTPTLDPLRNKIYIGTGQNFSEPATNTSDSIIALNMTTGAVNWIFQARRGDIWNAYTSAALTGSDYDFGASPIVVDDGATIIAGDKAGVVYSLDATNGSLNWSRKIGSGGTLGGVHWNMAVDGSTVYVGIADITSSKVNPDVTVPNNARPGVYALNIDTGNILWEAHPTHRYNSQEYPSLFSAAVSVTNDVVFAGSLDGVVRAFHADTGAQLWSYDTDINFTGVNGEPGKGGTIDSVGVVVGGNEILVNSGYNVFGGTNRYQAGPGNALFILSLP